MRKQQKKNKKVLVVGAGVVGVTTAYHLATRGYDVMVLDQATSPAAVCSHANAGLIAVGHATSWAGPSAPAQLVRSVLGKDPSVKISHYMDPALWRWARAFLGQCTTARHSRNNDAMLTLSRLGAEALKGIELETGLAYDQGATGVYYLYGTTAQLDERLKSNVGGNSGFTPCDAETLFDIDPALRTFEGSLKGGVVSTVDGKGDCEKFTSKLADWIQSKMGVQFVFGATATSFEVTGGAVSAVTSNKGDFDCDHVVIAAGIATPKLTKQFGIRPLIYPVKGYSATYLILDKERIPKRPFIDETSLLAVTQLGDRLRVTAIAEFDGYNTTVRADRVAYIDDYVRRHFTGAVDIEAARHWAGLRPSTPSGRPYLGRLRKVPNVYLNAGHGQLGWTMAAGAGEVVASMISDTAGDVSAVSETAPWLNSQ